MAIIGGAVLLALVGGWIWNLVDRALKRRRTIERRLFTRR